LLRGPRGGRVRGDVEVQHSPPFVSEEEEDEEDLIPLSGRPSEMLVTGQNHGRSDIRDPPGSITYRYQTRMTLVMTVPAPVTSLAK
jgi:hypothetical protein